MIAFMDLSHLFDVSPFLALSFCVCFGTAMWCTILLHRGCHHVADRCLIGFIGLLAVYQSVQILDRGGILSIPRIHHLDEAMELLVNSLYLLAALLLRMSNHDRVETIFRLRLAEAQPTRTLPEPILEQPTDPSVLNHIRAAVPLLSGNALKLYLYIYFHMDRRTGVLNASEHDLLKWASNDRKMLLSAFKELKERGLCEVELEHPNRPTTCPQVVKIL